MGWGGDELCFKATTEKKRSSGACSLVAHAPETDGKRERDSPSLLLKGIV